MAAASKARKLDCKCACTCGSQEGAGKAPQSVPFADRTNGQVAHAVPLQPSNVQQQPAEASFPTLRLPQISTAAVEAVSHPTYAFAADEHFTAAQPVFQTPSVVPEAPVNVVPKTKDMEAVEIVGVSPTPAEQASDGVSEPQVPIQSEDSGFLEPHQQSAMPTQGAVSTFVPPQSMLGTSMGDLGSKCEDIAVANMDSVEAAIPDMALMFPDQQALELPEQDVDFYQEGVEQVERDEIVDLPSLVPGQVAEKRP